MPIADSQSSMQTASDLKISTLQEDLFLIHHNKNRESLGANAPTAGLT